MRIEPIEFVFSDEEMEHGAVLCPVCGKPWSTAEYGDGVILEETECPHLRFAIEPQGDKIHCFNGFTVSDLLQAAKRSGYKGEANLKAFELSICHGSYPDTFWSKLKSPLFDRVFELTQDGVGCGPVSDTALFGAKVRR